MSRETADDLLEQRLTRIRHGEYSDELPDDTIDFGFLELTFQSGRTLLITTKSDWTLVVREGAWHDPFAARDGADGDESEPDIPRWTAVDVTAAETFAPLVGQTITRAEAIREDYDELKALELSCGDRGRLIARSYGGGLHVRVEAPA